METQFILDKLHILHSGRQPSPELHTILNLLGSKLPVDNSVKHLGMSMNPQLRFTANINARVSKAHAQACLIHREIDQH